jgi:drug/metabolite transporter (DMT)-like permease
MKKQLKLGKFSELNLALLLIATSGPLGRSLTMNPFQSIWWRALLSLLILIVIIKWSKFNWSVKKIKGQKTLLLSGVLMAIHWVTYFYALQLSGIAIGMLSLFTYPVITAFLEPLFTKNKVNLIQVLLAIIICLGMYLILPEFSLENTKTQGILWGTLSALSYSLRNLVLKSSVNNIEAPVIMFYQMLVTALLLLPSLFFFPLDKVPSALPALLSLALFTTCLGHSLFIRSFKNFSISTVSILSSIQPVYGIILGVLFLNETPSITTLIGGVLILSTVVIEGVLSTKKSI